MDGDQMKPSGQQPSKPLPSVQGKPSVGARKISQGHQQRSGRELLKRCSTESDVQNHETSSGGEIRMPSPNHGLGKKSNSRESGLGWKNPTKISSSSSFDVYGNNTSTPTTTSSSESDKVKSNEESPSVRYENFYSL